MKKKFIILILLFIILEIVALVFLNFGSLKKDEEVEKINLDVNSELVQNLYKMTNPSEEAYLLNELYGNTKLTNDYIIAIGIADYLKDNDPIIIENPTYVFDYIPSEDVDKHIKFVLGDVDEEKITNIIREKFKINTFKKKPIKALVEPLKVSRIKTVKEKVEAEQDNLIITLSLNNLTDYERNYPLSLYNAILGGGSESL